MFRRRALGLSILAATAGVVLACAPTPPQPETTDTATTTTAAQVGLVGMTPSADTAADQATAPTSRPTKTETATGVDAEDGSGGSSSTSTTSTTTAPTTSTSVPTSTAVTTTPPNPLGSYGLGSSATAASIPPTTAQPVDLGLPDPRFAAARTAPVVIERGHLDLVEVSVSGGRLVASTKDHTTAGGPTFRPPTDLQVRVGDAARSKVPSSPAFAFLGQAGSEIHLLPQTENPALVWPGWSTERITAGQLAGDVVTWRLMSVEGPGSFALFTTNQFGSPSVIFDSDAGGAKETVVRINTHAHGNWGFSAPGAYEVTFEVAADVAGAGPTATTATYVFLVGETTAPVDPGQVAPPQEDLAPSAPPVTDAGAAGSAGAVGAGSGSGAGGTGTPATGSSGSGAGGTGTTGGSGAADAATGSGSLARTGSSPAPGGLLGVLLLLGGMAAVVAARRVERSTDRAGVRSSELHRGG